MSADDELVAYAVSRALVDRVARASSWRHACRLLDSDHTFDDLLTRAICDGLAGEALVRALPAIASGEIAVLDRDTAMLAILFALVQIAPHRLDDATVASAASAFGPYCNNFLPNRTKRLTLSTVNSNRPQVITIDDFGQARAKVKATLWSTHSNREREAVGA